MSVTIFSTIRNWKFFSPSQYRHLNSCFFGRLEAAATVIIHSKSRFIHASADRSNQHTCISLKFTRVCSNHRRRLNPIQAKQINPCACSLNYSFDRFPWEYRQLCTELFRSLEAKVLLGKIVVLRLNSKFIYDVNSVTLIDVSINPYH